MIASCEDHLAEIKSVIQQLERPVEGHPATWDGGSADSIVDPRSGAKMHKFWTQVRNRKKG